MHTISVKQEYKRTIFIPFVVVALFLFVILEEKEFLESVELADFGEADEGLGDEVDCEFESLEYNICHYFLGYFFHKSVSMYHCLIWL